MCWLLKPNGTHAGKQVALTFGRFDIDRFDRIDIYDGNMVSSTRLSPVLGLWGLGSPVLGSPTSAHVNLHDLARNSSNGALLIEFHSDFEYAAAGFLFGWTVLPLPSDSAHFCATDCAVDERSRRAGMGLRGDGVCDAACMNGFCGWDGGDCLDNSQCAQECMRSMVGDGLCQPACLVPACDFDHRDCECDNVIETDSGYRTDGTRFGTHYENGLSGCWLLRPRLPGIRNLTLSFQRFSTERSYDVLRVYDGQQRWAKELYPGGLSGTLQPHGVTSSGPAILLTFQTDASLSKGGFLFGWTSNLAGEAWPNAERCARKCEATMLGDGSCDAECMSAGCEWDRGDCSHTCEHVISERNGFRSVGGPHGSISYHSKMRRCWLIRPAPPTRASQVTSIVLTFQHFETEAYFDVLHVFDGPIPMLNAELSDEAVGDKRVVGLSGVLRPGAHLRPITASSSSMLLTFRSDDSFSGDGFLFGWTTRFDTDPPLDSGECAFGCTHSMRGDGRCDSACMSLACSWDSKDEERRKGDCDAECSAGCGQELHGNRTCEPDCVTQRAKLGGGSASFWLFVLAVGGGCCTAWRGGRGLMGSGGGGAGGTVAAGRGGEDRWWSDQGARSLQYSILALWSRVRTAVEEVAEGRLTLRDVFAYLRDERGGLGGAERLPAVHDEDMLL